MVNYIICMVTDSNFERVTGLTKLKGPASIIKKITFPGGKIEAGETAEEAASREIMEEAGLKISESDWKIVKQFTSDDGSPVTIVHAYGHPEYAQQLEEEEIHLLQIDWSIKQAKLQPDAYAPDFICNLEAAKKVLNIA